MNVNSFSNLPPRPKVVIVGGGEAGEECADALKKSPVDIVVIDRNPYQTDKPDIWEVAVGEKDRSDMIKPLTKEFKGRNTTVEVATVTGFEPSANKVNLADGRQIDYDYLVVATGSQPAYFGRQDWASKVLQADNVDDPLKMRQRIHARVDEALLESDPVRRKELLQFAVVGGGATGVELAGVCHLLVEERAPHLLKDAQITLVASGQELLGGFPPYYRQEAAATLQTQGIALKLGQRVVDVQDGKLLLSSGESLPAREILWAAGTEVSGMLSTLGPTSGSGRVKVDPYLNPPHYKNVFVVGDASQATWQGQPVPANEDTAEQQGEQAGRNIARLLQGQAPQPFRYEAEDDWDHFGPVLVDGSRQIVRDD